MRVLVVQVILVAAALQGCTGRGCTDMGGYNGVDVQISRAVDVDSGRLTVELCGDEGCASATERLRPVPTEKSGRRLVVTFADLGRRFDRGDTVVTIALSDTAGSVVARARRDLELERWDPNGYGCDGNGYVVGRVEVGAGDRA